MNKQNDGYKEKELVKNDLKHAGDSIDKLRKQEEANLLLAAKEIGQVNENL
ncbi:hypothetical protein [Bacillus sp. 1P06AnD]|uniref:hypothetical protein n=1 Tax=Bacillus sp. 1P06AnD TaxID=3132208 RepID=UPI0039A0C382